MSEFSELLNHMIRVRGIQASKLAAYCGLERSSMYKILHGTRTLSGEGKLKKIADYLGLNQTDADQLKKCWEKSQYDEEDYYRKESVIEFLESFHRLTETSETDKVTFSLPAMSWNMEGPESEAAHETRPLRSSDALRQAIGFSLLKELSHPAPKVRILKQPDHETLEDLLYTFGSTAKSLRVEQIFHIFTGDEMNLEHQNRNLRSLTEILRLQLGLHDYQPYYCYGHAENADAGRDFPECMMITEDSLILFTVGLTDGIISRDPSVIRYFGEKFEQYKRAAHPVLTRCSGMEEYMYNMEFTGAFEGFFSYGLTTMPHVDLFAGRDLIQRQLRPDISNRDQIAGVLTAYLNHCHAMYRKFCPQIYTPLQAVEAFLREGRYDNYTPALFEPPVKAERKRMVRAMLEAPELQNIRYLKESWLAPEADLILYVSPARGFLRFTPGYGGELTLLQLTEPQLLRTFCDFFELILENEVYTQEEARQRIELLLESV